MGWVHHWLNDLMDGMDKSGHPEVCNGLLKQCGACCAKRNGLPGKELKEEVGKRSDWGEITRTISRLTGAECVPDGDGFLLTYSRGKSCDCPLVREGYIKSPVFCNCTLGFHEMLWSEVFEQPVTVELRETFLRGGDCCAQKITLK